MSTATEPQRSLPSTALRGAAKKALRGWGIATSPARSLPDFIVIGGKRCGTTSLFRNLSSHPGVVPLFPAVQQVKGTHFFDTNYHRGRAWYRSHFPTRTQLTRLARRDGDKKVTGEASPYYLFHPHAAKRARRGAPDARLIVLLRDPVDRAYSHYRERVRHGVEDLSFEEALRREDERLAGEEERMLDDESYYSFAHEHLSYFRQGLYADALTRWFECFPREQFLFLLSEQLFSEPEPAYRAVTDWLGLPPLPATTFEKHNWHPGSPLADDTREHLARRYREPNRALEKLLELDLSRWS